MSQEEVIKMLESDKRLLAEKNKRIELEKKQLLKEIQLLKEKLAEQGYEQTQFDFTKGR